MLNTFLRRHLRRVGALALLFLAGGLPLTLATANASTVGEQQTAVILVNFQDNTSQPISKTDANALVFGAVSDYYWEASYQKTFLSGATYGWVTIPVSESLCDNFAFAREADKAVTATGVDLSKYERLIYLLPQKLCRGGGVNTGPGSPSRMWVTANAFDAQLIIHELGHNFGLLHSGAMDCGATVIGEDCTVSTYGDPADTMGSGTATHFNATHKQKLGWIGASGQPAVTTITRSGSYELSPFESPDLGVKAIRIPRGVDPVTGEQTYYYLEYRQPLGFDSKLGSMGNVTQGLLVHTSGVNQDSVLLDMTPNSNAASEFYDVRDGALAVGRTYVDTLAGVSFALKSADAAGALVEVGLSGDAPVACTRQPPVLSIVGPTTPVVAGSAIDYTVSLGNRDSSGCSATSFNLAYSVPDNWSGVIGANALSLSPGSTGTTTLTVTSLGNAATGNHGVGVGSSSGYGSVHVASASIVYAVAPAASSPTLTAAIGTNKAEYARGELVYISARVLADAVPVAGAEVRFSVTPPAGNSTVLKAVSGADGYARATFKVGKGKGALGGYSLQADASNGGQTVTATGQFSVR